MEASSLDAGSLASSFDILRNEGDFERYGSLLRSGSCTSPVSSLLTIDTPDVSFNADRGVSTGSISPEDFANSSGSITSPLTPIDPGSMNDFCVREGWELGGQRGWTSQQPASASPWLSADDTAMADGVVSDGMDGSPTPHLQQPFFYPSGHLKWAVDPTLSRAAVSGDALMTSYYTTGEKLPWANTRPVHAQTIEPNATFQTVLPISPATKIEPTTPLRYHREDSSAFASGLTSPALSPVIASQWDVDDFSWAPIGEIPVKEDLYYQALLPSTRKPVMRKQARSLRKIDNVKSGIDCEAIITQNSFVCSIPGCNKRFKRAEHRKRHESTVNHQSIKVGKHSPKRHYCWVVTGNKPCGRWFTRPDNLKSHKIKTHGKKSPNQRNAYVATLDEKSQYYDPGWEGPLTTEGLPIGHPRWPEIN